MGGVRMAVYAVLLLALLFPVGWALRAPESAVSQDAALVYCLQPARQGNLVDAAVSLGLAGADSTVSQMRIGGRQLTLTEWRSADKGAFLRACDALAADAMPAPSGNAVTPTLTNPRPDSPRLGQDSYILTMTRNSDSAPAQNGLSWNSNRRRPRFAFLWGHNCRCHCSTRCSDGRTGRCTSRTGFAFSAQAKRYGCGGAFRVTLAELRLRVGRRHD